MSDFPKKVFRVGDPEEKLFDTKFLNWLSKRAAKSISAGAGLVKAENDFGVVLGLAKQIAEVQIVELVKPLEEFGIINNGAYILERTEGGGLEKSNVLIQANIEDWFGQASVIGSRGFIIEASLTDKKRWVYCPCGGVEPSSSSTSSSGYFSSSGGPACFKQIPNDITIVPNYDPNSVQLLGHEGGSRLGCLKWYDVEQCVSSSG